MKEKEIGILYLSLHSHFIRKYGVGNIMKRTELVCKIAKHGQVPKKIRHLVVKEMEDKKLIEKINRDDIKLLEVEIDLEKDANKLYQLAGIY